MKYFEKNWGSVMGEQLDNAFLTYACGILADTNKGLSGSKIVEYCSAYAIEFMRDIPQSYYPFNPRTINKRTALRQNLEQFNAKEQFKIIKDLCEIDSFRNNNEIKNLKTKLYTRYNKYADDEIEDKQLIIETKHWLQEYPKVLCQYDNSLEKFKNGIYERNTLDDMRLAFELLVKDILNNNKSLENQLSELGTLLKDRGVSDELRNMVATMIGYYTKFQNNHVKHNDLVNENEVEYVIELTSVLMKFLIKIY